MLTGTAREAAAEFLGTVPGGLLDQVVGTALLLLLVFALGDVVGGFVYDGLITRHHPRAAAGREAV